MNKCVVVICLMWDIMHDVVIDVLGVAIVFKILVVSVYSDRDRCADKEVMPVVKSSHEGQKFPVMDVEITFCF